MADTFAVIYATEVPAWPLYAALITAGAGLLGQAVVRLKEARDMRRDEYSRAFAAAMRWAEFPYRIARRLSNEPEVCSPIIDAFHETQEEICFHENWLRSVSDDIANAYSDLVRAVKAKSRPHIEAAWRRAPAEIPEGMILGDLFPVTVSSEVAEFAKEIRQDLSWWRRLTAR